MHNGVTEGYFVHDRRLDTKRLTVKITSADNFGFIAQSQKSVKMLLSEDLSVIFIVQGMRTELLFDLLLYGSHKLILYRPVAVDVIRRDAGLAAV